MVLVQAPSQTANCCYRLKSTVVRDWDETAAPRLMLHAARLTFRAPGTEEVVEGEAAVPF